MTKNKKKTFILVTHTFTFTTIHLKHDIFTQICTNISYTRTTAYEHMHISNPPPKSGKIKCCHLANIEYFFSLYSRFVPAEIYECCHLANIMSYIRRCLFLLCDYFCDILSAILEFVIRFVSNFYN